MRKLGQGHRRPIVVLLHRCSDRFVMVNRLVTLILAVVAFGVNGDLSANEQNSYAHDKEISVKLHKLGAIVRLSDEGHITAIGFPRTATNKTLSLLKGLGELSEVYIRCPKVTDDGIAHLKGLRRLKSIHLNGSKVTDAGLAHLSTLSELRSLSLTATQITDAGLLHLANATYLRRLDVAQTVVTDAGVNSLRAKLRQLDVYPESPDEIRSVKALVKLPIQLTISDDDWVVAAPLEYKPLSVEMAKHLRGLSRLETLVLRRKSADNALAQLSGHPAIKKVDMFHDDLTTNDFDQLATLPSLQELRVGMSLTQVSDEHLNAISRMKNLEILHLSHHLGGFYPKTSTITDVGMSHLQGMTQLRELHLVTSKITDAGLTNLAMLSNLRSLHIYAKPPVESSAKKQRLGDKGVAQLSGLSQLESLHLQNVKITDAGIEHLSTLGELRELRFNWAAFGDKGIEKLKNFKKLRMLAIGDAISVAQMRTIQKSLPNAHVYFVDSSFPRPADLIGDTPVNDKLEAKPLKVQKVKTD